MILSECPQGFMICMNKMCPTFTLQRQLVCQHTVLAEPLAPMTGLGVIFRTHLILYGYKKYCHKVYGHVSSVWSLFTNVTLGDFKVVRTVVSLSLQRRYSPGWASASFRSFLHPSRFRAATFQFLHPSLPTSSSTPSPNAVWVSLWGAFLLAHWEELSWIDHHHPCTEFSVQLRLPT